jgi:hypothetical protein
MVFSTFLLTVLVVLGVQLQCAVGQIVYKPETSNSVPLNAGHKFNLVYSAHTGYAPNFRNSQLQKPDYRLQLSHYTRYNAPLTFTLRNTPSPDDWLYEHNLVTVKSIIAIVDRLTVGISCHYNWAFAIAGNGLGMVLNKAPIKISFAAVVGGAPNLYHR